MNIFLAYIETEHLGAHEQNVEKITNLLKGYKRTNAFIYKYPSTGEQNFNSFEVFDAIKKSDIFVGEMSRPSQTLGFLLAYAVSQGKPSMYLYSDDTKGKPGYPIADNPNRLLVINSYNQNNLSEKIDSFIQKAQKQLLSDRITFVCSKAVREYIDHQAAKSGLAKGEIIRSIIEEKIEKENQS